MANKFDKDDYKILDTFNNYRIATFEQLKKSSSLDTEILNSKIRLLIDSGIIKNSYENSSENNLDKYTLTDHGEKLLPHLVHLHGTEVGNLCVVLCAVVHDDYVLLMKRKKRPYQGYTGLIGGKLKLEDTIKEASEREVLEETGLKAEYVRTFSVLHERITENKKYKLGMVIFFCMLKPNRFDKNEIFVNEEGDSKWFKIKDVKGDEFIPSDVYMLNNVMDEKITVFEATQSEDNISGLLGRFDIHKS